jgi:hypothetical protein
MAEADRTSCCSTQPFWQKFGPEVVFGGDFRAPGEPSFRTVMGSMTLRSTTSNRLHGRSFGDRWVFWKLGQRGNRPTGSQGHWPG